jgi:hypothetical protein
MRKSEAGNARFFRYGLLFGPVVGSAALTH